MQRKGSDELVEAMLVASRALVAIAARSLASAPGEVTLPQFRALVVLASRGEQSASALADELRTAPSSVTRMCDRLVRKGLIERRPSATDGRQVAIHCTQEGRELVDRVTAERRAEIVTLVGSVPVDQRQALTDALLALGHAAGEVPEQSWSTGWRP